MAACGGGRQRQTVTTCQTTRAARRRAAPAAHMRPRPAGRTTPAQKRHPRAKQTAGARRVPPPPKSTKFLVLCASVRPGSQNANFVDLPVAAAPPRGAIHPPGARGPRPPLFGGLRRSLYGGGTTTPPHGRCVTCDEIFSIPCGSKVVRDFSREINLLDNLVKCV